MKKVKKAIIPAAGLGTRFFPATKTIPKEMLPLVDRPTILYVIEEAIQAGIEDIVLIQGRGKTAIEDFFDVSYELEDKLLRDGKSDVLESINKIRSSVNIISVRQKAALGLGHAVRCGKSVIGEDPFAVLLGDEVTLSKNRAENVTAFLSDRFAETYESAVWVLKVLPEEVSKYGIVDVGSENKDLSMGKKILGVFEKPEVGTAPSDWALPGRYVFDSKIIDLLENTLPGKNGEIQLSDAMNELAKTGKINAFSFSSKRFDAGDKLGFLIANIEIALDRPDLSEDLMKYLKNRIK
jgi:UTP--glucose-1-phosphate uridylyltransferase